MNNPLDELFGIVTPPEVRIQVARAEFLALKTSVKDAEESISYGEDNVSASRLDRISNQLSWFEDDFHHLVSAYENMMYMVDKYRQLLTDRLTEDEVFCLNTIKVQRCLMKSR